MPNGTLSLSFHLRKTIILLVALSGIAGPRAWAQGPTVVSITPTRHAPSAARTANVQATFSQPITAASATAAGGFQVFGNQMRGSRPGVVSGGGTTALTFDPTQNFAPGETVNISLTPTLLGSGGAVQGQVAQFRAATGGTGSGNFVPSSTISTTISQQVAVAGDVDNDGDLDLVTAATTINSVSVRYNNGAGGFAVGSSSAQVYSNTRGLALGDVDRDGDLDLLSVHEQYVYVKVNNGAGVFSGSTYYFVGRGSRALALGDIDADGDLDILTANYDDNSVSRLLNNGAGVFVSATDQSVGPQPTDLVLGDFDNDGDLDLAVTSQNASNSLSTGTVRTLTNNGTGSFAAATVVNVGQEPRNLAAGDMDNDGDLDLIATNATDFTAVLLRNSGTGAFAAGPPLNLGNYPMDLTLGDVDADGDLDFLTANSRPGASTVSLVLNSGSGTFAAPTIITGLTTPIGLALSDLDADGDLDLTVVQQAANSFALLFNQPLATPVISSFTPMRGAPGTPVTLTGTNFTTATQVTFNGMAAPDFAVLSATQLRVLLPAGATTGPIALTTAAGTATGPTNFLVTAPVRVTSRLPARHATSAPANGPVGLVFDQPITAASAADLLVMGDLRRGSRAGTASVAGNGVSFQPSQAFAPGEHVTVTVPTTLASGNTGNTLREVYQFTAATSGTGRGTFIPIAGVPLPTRPAYNMVSGDLDGDGDIDLIAATQYYASSTDHSAVQIRMNNGAGTFSGTQSLNILTAPQYLNTLRLGDVDGDGDLDLLAATSTNTNISPVQVSYVTVYLNNGQGSFSVSTGPTLTFFNCSDIQLGDLDGDGDLDLAALDLNPGNNPSNVDIRLNNGQGVFMATARPVVATGPSCLHLVDYDNDGDLDILTPNVSGNMSLLPNDGNGRFPTRTDVVLLPFSTINNMVVGDVNGDGNVDVITNNSTINGILGVHLGNGQGGFAPPTAIGNVSVYDVYIMTLGDIDADGDLDLMLGGVDSGGGLVLLRNDGTGIFTRYMSLPTISERGDQALVDLDGDGDLDILSAGGSNNPNLIVALNQPYPAPVIGGLTPTSGVVGTQVQLLGSNLDQVTRVAFNGTTAPGFTIDSPSQITATVPMGATTGPVTATNSVGQGTSPGVFTVLQRAMVMNYTPARHAAAAPRSQPITLNLSQPLPALGYPYVQVNATLSGRNPQYSVSGNGTTTLTIGHGRLFHAGEKVRVSVPALPVATGFAYAKEVFDFTVAASGTGRGNFSGSTALPTGQRPVATAVGDLNGDGNLDAVVVSHDNNSLTVYTGNGLGTLTPGPPFAVNYDPVDVALTDYDNDNDLDLFVLSSLGSTGSLLILNNNGFGAFSFGGSPTLNTAPTALALADVNADGLSDLLIAGAGPNALLVMLHNAYVNLGFYSPTSYPIPAAPQGLTLADVDNDGDLDAVVSYPGSNAVGTLLNDGDGRFTANATLVAVGTSPQGLAVDDLDGDGDVDLAVANGTAGTVSLRWGDGQGGFSTGPTLAVGTTPNQLVFGDVDADGDFDILVTNRGSNTVTQLLNNGSGTFAAATAIAVGNGPAGLALGDVDSDGDLDLITTNSTANTISLRLNGGSGPAATATPTWANEVALFPNPAHAQATLQLPSLPASRLILRNALGQVVQTQELSARTTAVVVPLQHLAPGLYLLHLDAGASGQLVKPLVVE